MHARANSWSSPGKRGAAAIVWRCAQYSCPIQAVPDVISFTARRIDVARDVASHAWIHRLAITLNWSAVVLLLIYGNLYIGQQTPKRLSNHDLVYNRTICLLSLPSVPLRLWWGAFNCVGWQVWRVIPYGKWRSVGWVSHKKLYSIYTHLIFNLLNSELDYWFVYRIVEIPTYLYPSLYTADSRW